MTAIRYGILGPLEVRSGEATITPAGSRQRLLLAVLVLDANRIVSADRLVEELWGDVAPQDPAGALRTQVSRLRRALGEAGEDLVTTSAGLQLRVGTEQLDASVFEDLISRAREAEGEAAIELIDSALGLWRGRAIEEFADRFFAQSEAVRLEEIRTTAQEDRARILLEQHRADEAVAALERIVLEHPEREATRALLMESLYKQGRHTEALETYQSWRRRLADELGLDPSPELVELERKILSHTLVAEDNIPAPRGVPMPVSSFVGRDSDVAAVRSLLDEARLVSLCGAGGVGKTRLALEVVRLIADRYPDGVRLCDLVSVRRPSSVARAIATVVGVQERGRRRIDDQIVDHLKGRRLLLVLDNCEHVVGAAAAVARRVLEETRGVDVLTTSRERLGTDGEHVWPVAPLDAAGPHAAAVELFCDRARAVDPNFVPDEDAIRSICAQLDGLPLAIELAAARLRAMTLAELAGRLDQRLRLLSQDTRPDIRHRSLRAVVDWSYEQLPSNEQRVFDRLSVFAGRFDMSAAREVAAQTEISADDIPELILRLIDRSLIVVHRRGSASLYALLDTLRTYGVERLTERENLEDARDAHARWAVGLAERAGNGLAGPDEATWADALDTHFDDLREAHVWLVGRDVDLSMRLVAALHWFALWHSKSEIFRWAETSAAAASGSGSRLLPTVLTSAAAGAWQRGELDDAAATARAALDAARDLDAVEGRRAAEAAAEVCLLRGELDRAAELFQQAYERSVEAGDTLSALWEIGSVALAHVYGGSPGDAVTALAEMRTIADASGGPSALCFTEYVEAEVAASTDAARAERHLREAIRFGKRAGSRFLVGLSEVSLASLLMRHGDPAAALANCEQVIVEWRETAAWMPLSVTLRTLVELLTRLRAYDDAAVLYGAIYSGRIGASPFGQDEIMLGEAETVLRAELGDDGFRESADRGGALSIDEAAAFALDSVRRADRASNVGS